MNERQLTHRLADILLDTYLGLTDASMSRAVALAMARAAIEEVRREDKREWSGYD